MQVHVVVADTGPVITIFSKSKRDSTLDRLNTHSCVQPDPLCSGEPVFTLVRSASDVRVVSSSLR
jgi:hypothetical protein